MVWGHLQGKKYSIIYPDPPWTYRDKAKAGERGAESKYATMRLEDIQELPVYELAADNCALFLWVTWPLLREGLDTMYAWGFDYRTIAFNWVKTNKDGSPKMTLGHYTRSGSEPCLLGIRGRMKRKSASVSSTVLAPISKHSAKPPEVRDRIVQLFGNLPRVELFARDAVDGWDRWGLEAPPMENLEDIL